MKIARDQPEWVVRQLEATCARVPEIAAEWKGCEITAEFLLLHDPLLRQYVARIEEDRQRQELGDRAPRGAKLARCPHCDKYGVGTFERAVRGDEATIVKRFCYSCNRIVSTRDD